VNFLKSFFFAASCFIIPPEGVEIPEEVSMRTPDSARRLVASRQLARLALSETLLFQAALDMRAVGIDFIRTPISYGFLGASDIAMFRLMRERGLVDVIRRYYSFMKPHEREAFDSSVEAVSSHLIDGGAKTFLWQPRWPEVRPEVRRTFLDDVADAYAGYESGLFERSGGLQTLSQDRIAAIVGSMEGSVETTDDIGAVFSAIREVAPNVGEKVMSGEVMRFVDIVLVEGDGTDQRVLSRDSSLSGLIGEPRDPERDRVRIEIVKGTPKREIVGELVVHLARLTVPPALVAGYRGSMGPDRDSIRSVLTNMYAAMDMWGLSGAFEMYHEARLSGLDMSFNDTYSAIRAIIESLGFAVACERWSELLPQRIVSAVERMMTGYAVRAAAARAWGRPVTVLRQ
jgi:hypothetical protein